jgi:hypothetical protein
MAGVPEHELSSAVVAKTIAYTTGPDLHAGISVCPAPHQYGTDVGVVGAFPARWELVEPSRITSALAVEDAVFARPLPGRTIAAQRDRVLLVRSAKRLQRLVELEAPAIVRERDERSCARLWTRLVEQGWTREADPLPDDLVETIARTIASRTTSRSV